MADWLSSLLGLGSGDPTIAAANQNKGVISQYGTDANSLIDQGSTAAGGYLNSTANSYAPLAADATAKGQLYANALGVNGAAGNAAATSAFQTSPGYQFSLDQGLQALDRSAAAHGTLQSGQSGIDTVNYGVGAANNEYQNWLGQLGSSNDILGTGLTGAANANSNLANLATGTSSAKVGVAGDVASGNIGANNQTAAGQQANDAGLANLGKTIIGGAANIFGYGGF